jgi:hypothetical protein
VSVDIYDSDVKAGTTDAVRSRDDLAKGSIGDGDTPSTSRCLRPLVMAKITSSVRIGGTTTALIKSPKRLNCPKQ